MRYLIAVAIAMLISTAGSGKASDGLVDKLKQLEEIRTRRIANTHLVTKHAGGNHVDHNRRCMVGKSFLEKEKALCNLITKPIKLENRSLIWVTFQGSVEGIGHGKNRGLAIDFKIESKNGSGKIIASAASPHFFARGSSPTRPFSFMQSKIEDTGEYTIFIEANFTWGDAELVDSELALRDLLMQVVILPIE